MLDVVGRRLEQIPPTNVLEVTRRWPRDGSGELLLSETSRQAEQRPDSRAALLHRLGSRSSSRPTRSIGYDP